MERGGLINRPRVVFSEGYIAFYYNTSYDSVRNYAFSYSSYRSLMNNGETMYNSIDRIDVLKQVKWIPARRRVELLSLVGELLQGGYISETSSLDKLSVARAVDMRAVGYGIDLIGEYIRSDECPHCKPCMSNMIRTGKIKKMCDDLGIEAKFCAADAVSCMNCQSEFPIKHLRTYKDSDHYYLVTWMDDPHDDVTDSTKYIMNDLTAAVLSCGYVAAVHPKQSYDHFHLHCFSRSIQLDLWMGDRSIQSNRRKCSVLAYWTFAQLEELISVLSGKLQYEEPFVYENTHLFSNGYLPIHLDKTDNYYEALVLMSCIYGYGLLPKCLINKGKRIWPTLYAYHKVQWETTLGIMRLIRDEVAELVPLIIKDNLYGDKILKWPLPSSARFSSMRTELAKRPGWEIKDGFGGPEGQIISDFVTVCDLDDNIDKRYFRIWRLVCSQSENTSGWVN